MARDEPDRIAIARGDDQLTYAGLDRDVDAMAERLVTDLGWGPHATEGVRIVDLHGSHDRLLNEPHVAVVAEALRADIDRALAHTPS